MRCGSRCTTTSGSWCSSASRCSGQLHYLIEEHSKTYYRFWQKTVFGGLNERLSKLDDWTRFRAARAFKLFVFLFFLSCVLGRIFKTEPVWLGLLEAPARLVAALPFVFQLMFGFLFIVVQFGGLFWFLSRGGIDTYMPDDMETRFSDVKGQDPVLDRVQENMIFLEDPESIEERGGYVPGGLLLWGPPGTGKTLMAKAVAGETAKPFVFVDPGAFVQMFMGVGILKVKSLYRKLRKLAVRYGGVIVFFDEADSLGNRGSLGGQARRLELRRGERLRARPAMQRLGVRDAGHSRYRRPRGDGGREGPRSSWAAWGAAAGWARCRRCCRRCPA